MGDRDVTDSVRETPSLGVAWCPKCEPHRDPRREILDVRWCGEHPNTPEGKDDGVPEFSGYAVGSAECEGESNKRWCDVLHRGRR